MTTAIEVEKSKNASFREKAREFQPGERIPGLNLTCGAWTSGCTASGRENKVFSNYLTRLAQSRYPVPKLYGVHLAQARRIDL